MGINIKICTKVNNFNFSSSKFSHLKWLTQLVHSLGLANKGGTACRIIVIHLETNCLQTTKRWRFFKLLKNIFLSLNTEFNTKPKLHCIWIYLQWLWNLIGKASFCNTPLWWIFQKECKYIDVGRNRLLK